MTEIVVSIGGYRAVAGWDGDALCYHGELIDIRDVVTFSAERLEDLEAAMMASVQDYLEFCDA